MAVPDGVWNHGEGFGANYIDHGGWHDVTDGTNVTAADVHVNLDDRFTTTGVFVYDPPLHPAAAVNLVRQEGYLRPASLPLPQSHPLYGQLSEPYVDQGAFEMFRPGANWDGVKKILIIIHTQETIAFPLDHTETRLGWRHIYRGFFSADGLVRNEIIATQRSHISEQMFLDTDDNDDDGEVERPLLATLANWSGTESYWPIEAYPVLSVMERSTTLNEQRQMQLLQAVKALLSVADTRNPLYPVVIPPADVEQHVVVAFMGGSNGGMQSSLACLRYPHLVHGAFAAAINPSYQRLYAEFDLDRALARLAGASMGPSECTENDFLTWNQYVWSQGLEMHDMSVLRHFVNGTSYRSFCFTVGDEDTTSTGTNWIRVLDGAMWRAHGVAQGNPAFGGAHHTFAWTAGTGARHQFNLGPVTNPYFPNNSNPVYTTADIAKDMWPGVIQQRAATLGQSIPVPALTHTPRPAGQLGGGDDPQEWFLGRSGEPPSYPPPSNQLSPDTAWNDAVNPGSTGTMPGGKEAMFIRDNMVYVGGADGFVSRFSVANTPKRELIRQGRSVKLGHACFALAPVPNGSDWSVVAGTRRRLYKLSKDLLTELAHVDLDWEVAEPHHVACAEVLGSNPGPEIICATIHGGLCFFDMQLNEVFEWPEPGILDFFVKNGALTILSQRGVLANVTFDTNNVATLHAASKSIPAQLQTYGATPEACQGGPFDMELMRVNWSAFGYGVNLAAISTWRGDTDGHAVRGHWLSGLQQSPFLSLQNAILDIAVCAESNSLDAIGDHCLVLQANRLKLFDQIGQLVGEKDLVTSLQGRYPFGGQAHGIVVGELAGGGGSSYSEEVVVATNTGLMWMHVSELAAPGVLLPAQGTLAGAFQGGFWIEVGSQEQPRTNQCMQATWAMARRPGLGGAFDQYLHVLDQRGAYWRIAGSPSISPPTAQLRGLTAATGARSWTFVGPLSDPSFSGLTRLPFGAIDVLQSAPYCTKNSEHVVLEDSSGPFVVNNWLPRVVRDSTLDGFFVHPYGGSVATSSNGTGVRVWNWQFGFAIDPTLSVPAQDSFINLLVGYSASSSGVLNGVWASTATPDPISSKVDHLKLRSYMGSNASLMQQSVAAFELQHVAENRSVVVLGCPGGRVRVLRPGVMISATSAVHALSESIHTSDDLGLGGAAMAVRHESQGSDRLRIWFAPTVVPEARPSSYSPGAGLAPNEVASTKIYQLEWTPSTPQGQALPALVSAELHPTAANLRGAWGATAMLVTNLVDNAVAGFGGDELVVATASGDIVVYAIHATTNALSEMWRSYVEGAIGGLHVADLNLDGRNELYVASSAGLRRFVQPPLGSGGQ